MSRENDLVGTTRAELVIDRDRLMARGKLIEHGAGYRPVDHDVRRPVRLKALERLKTEHGIVPGMPAPEDPARVARLVVAELAPGPSRLRQRLNCRSGVCEQFTWSISWSSIRL